MKIIKFLLIIILVGILCSCTQEKGIILFNSVPITQNNALHDQKVFRPGSKVYFLFIAPKKMYNDFIRVQIFTLTDKGVLGGEDMLRTKDFRLMKDERYYYSDYFTLWDTGRYVMQVFSHDDFTHPIAVNYFYIQ